MWLQYADLSAPCHTTPYHTIPAALPPPPMELTRTLWTQQCIDSTAGSTMTENSAVPAAPPVDRHAARSVSVGHTARSASNGHTARSVSVGHTARSVSIGHTARSVSIGHTVIGQYRSHRQIGQYRSHRQISQ